MFVLGSVSTGTLRPEDLLEVFAHTLENLTTNGTPLTEAAHIAYRQLMDDDDDAAYENASEIIQELEDAINENIPVPFVYFGAHEGDGADFGFWPDHEGLQEAINNAENTAFGDDECNLEEEGLIVQISDHGNVTVYDSEHNELWSCV